MSKAEEDFIRKIDASLPLDDYEACLGLIEEARSISLNASFNVLFEICNPPRGVKERVGREQVQKLLEAWFRSNEHPLADVVRPAAQALVNGDEMRLGAAIEMLEAVAPYPWQLNALAIPYFASEYSEELDDRYEAIKDAWRKEDQPS